MRRQIILLTLGILLLTVGIAAENPSTSLSEPAFLWVVDQNTGFGVADASIAIGPGSACVGLTNPIIPTWTAHYVTDRAGRARLRSLPSEFSCCVELNGRVLEVVSASGMSARPWPGPKWMQLEHVSQRFLIVERSGPTATEDLHYWENTSDPTQFRSYIEDLDAGQLLSNVTVTARRSRINTTSDENGLFTLDIPKSYRSGVSPPGAVETLVFSKVGYRRFEYKNLIL